MSHASVKQPSPSGQKLSLDDLFDLGLKLLSTSIKNVRLLMRQAQPFMPQMPSVAFGRSRCSCAIPEQACPPRCVCDVTWESVAGETMSLAVHVTNASHVARTFQLHATPFVGTGASPGMITVTPSNLSLAAGQSGVVNATFTVPTAPEGDYYAEIVVHGAYEQAVCVTLKVQCKKTCGEDQCTCCIVQGDPPVQIRAHQWYHHFQCSEPCIDPNRKTVEPSQ